MGTIYKGIDISAWQGAPDFSRVKTDGVQFIIARAGYGSNNIDKQFRRNADECNRLGIPLGVYWFSYALTAAEAAQEARYCLEAVKPYRLEYPIYFDLEYDTIRYAAKNGVTITKALATQMVTAFCNEIERARHYAAKYSNADYLTRMFDQKALARYDLWYAWYNSKCNRSDAGVWQYSSKGRVGGISGNVDMDYSMKDYPGIIRRAGLNDLGKETPQAPAPAQTPTQTSASSFKPGNKVKVKKAVTYMGGTFKTYYSVYDVISVSGDRVVIGIGSTVTAAVNAANLQLASGTASESAPAPKPIAKGDKVKVRRAIQYNGKAFKAYYNVYDVISVSGDRAVIGIGSTVTAAVNISNLIKL
jgi:GH25 family lysozyme M1 (1,4-beta-N-acetylmuramidase)